MGKMIAIIYNIEYIRSEYLSIHIQIHHIIALGDSLKVKSIIYIKLLF